MNVSESAVGRAYNMKGVDNETGSNLNGTSTGCRLRAHERRTERSFSPSRHSRRTGSRRIRPVPKSSGRHESALRYYLAYQQKLIVVTAWRCMIA